MREPKKYRKKPVVIDAIQYTGDNADDIERFVGRKLDAWRDGARFGLLIPTLESPHEASVGDYILRGVQGEYYPCKPDIFTATYEEVKS